MQELVNCTSHRTITVYFACLTQKDKLNNCLSQYTTDEMYDAYRDVALKEKLDRMNKY